MNQLDKLQRWLLYTPFGQHVLRNELAFYQQALPNIFGYYALQTGLPEINFLQENKIRSHYVLNQDVKCYLNMLPFETNSIDLIVCPHILELTEDYEAILAELYRVLIAKGKLVITCFNPHSLFTTFGQKQEIYPDLNFIKLRDLKRSLNQLKFRIDGGQFIGYIPPMNNPEKIAKLDWLDKVGNRWFPTFANAYGIIATKELVSPIRIKPQTKAYKAESVKVVQLGGATRSCHNKL